MLVSTMPAPVAIRNLLGRLVIRYSCNVWLYISLNLFQPYLVTISLIESYPRIFIYSLILLSKSMNVSPLFIAIYCPNVVFPHPLSPIRIIF